MGISFFSSNVSNKTRTMNSNSDNIETIIGHETKEIIDRNINNA